MKNDDRKRVISSEFKRRFASEPEWWTRAPGRVDLMGSHTDYNLGYVLTLAINRDTWIAARSRNDPIINVHSLNVDTGSTVDLKNVEHDTIAPWTDYVRGVASVLLDEGYPLQGFDGLVHSSIPLNSGLSSSAALEVATAVLFQEMGHLDIEPLQLALLCQRAENQFVGVSCGILDQYTSVFGKAGHALLLDCRDLINRQITMPTNLSVVICDTRADRELATSEYADRRAQCEEGARRLAEYYPSVHSLRDVTLARFAVHEADLPPIVARRSRFIIEENRRVLEMAKALRLADREAIGHLTRASYTGARDFFEIVSMEMNAMMNAMLDAPGIIGARQAGGGFGGCLVAFVDSTSTEDFAQEVGQAYAARTGIRPAIYPVQASSGAGLFPVS